MTRTHWTTHELCIKLGPRGSPLHRSRLYQLALNRGVKPIGESDGRGREYHWPADADVKLKPNAKYRRNHKHKGESQ